MRKRTTSRAKETIKEATTKATEAVKETVEKTTVKASEVIEEAKDAAADIAKAPVVEEAKETVKKAVKDFCGILGLDPLYMGNEGKMAIAVDPADAAKALEIIRGSKYGADAAIIGSVIAVPEEEKPALLLETTLGGRRIMGPLYGEGLPRIC